MWRFLFFFSLLIVAAAVMVRNWYGKRLVVRNGARPCRANAKGWQDVFGVPLVLPKRLPADTAEGHGKALRLAALAYWKNRDAKGALARESSLRFGAVVPAFTLVVLFFAVVTGRMMLVGGMLAALAIFLMMVALSVVFGLISIGPELRAVNAAIRLARERHLFPRSEDESAACACARAEVWMASLPPVLRWM